MKRYAVGSALALLFLVFSLVLFLPWAVVHPGAGEYSFSLEGDGTAVLACNSRWFSTIFRVDGENNLLSVYREPNRGGATAITQAAGDGGRVYFIRQAAGGWELAGLDAESGDAVTLWRSKADPPEKPSLSAVGGEVYLAGVGEGKSGGESQPAAELYRLATAEGKGGLERVCSVMIPGGREVAAAVYAGEASSCALLEGGEVVMCSSGGVLPLEVPDGAEISDIAAHGGFLWLYSEESGKIFTGVGGRFTPIDAPPGLVSGAATAPDNMLLLAEGGGSKVFLRRTGGGFEAVTFTAPLSLRVLARLPALAAAVGAALAVLLLFWLFVWLVFYGKRLALRVGAVYSFASAAVCGAALGVVYSLAPAALPGAAVLCGLLFALFSALFFVLLRKMTRPIAEISHRMDELSAGNYKLRKLDCGNDEIGLMWRSMQEMAVGIGIRDYETRAVLEACRRFVPRGLNELLGCGSITEVNFGDSAAIEGDIALIAVNNGEHQRGRLGDDEFMDFVNLSFSVISKNTRPRGGVLLTAGFDLKAIKVFYPRGADDSLRSALALLGEKAAADGTPAPNFFVLLHSARFLYGIAGEEKEAFPTITSSELDFFSGGLKRFAAAGCRLVATEETIGRLSAGYSARYIGFMTFGDKRYRLFELLGSYGEPEKNLREQYDAKFQEGIEKFYQNDFYLACGLFLAVLRICPEDGVARWYLFACQRYFNSGPGENPDYSLFGG